MNQKNPKRLLNIFTTGTLLVLLLCLCATAFDFSMTFLGKEKERSAIAIDQLSHTFSFQYRSMSEEVYTKSYEAVGLRIADVAKHFGNAKYTFMIADQNSNCVYNSTLADPEKCVLSTVFKSAIANLTPSSGTETQAHFDEKANAYVYAVPLYIGAVLRGYVYATISDPFDFYRGHSARLAIRAILPTIVFVLILWGFWVSISRRFILKPYFKGLVELEKKDALGKLAAQIAHDIQSPLAALTSVVQDSQGLPADQNQLLKLAASRIQSLTSDLLARYKDTNSSQQPRFSIVSTSVQSIVAEKTAVLGEKSDIQIKVEIDPAAMTTGVSVSTSNLMRSLSNVMNNALDAVKDQPIKIVAIRVQRNENDLQIIVTDTGKGMSPEVLHAVRNSGGTFGKENGHGLGLQMVKETVIEANGSFRVDSDLGRGTAVTLSIPIAPNPPWCTTKIEFDESDKIVVLDDDDSVHLLWKQRLSGHDVTYIKDPEDFDVEHFPPNKYRYIFDYEIRGSAVTGLDLIVTNNLGSRSFLVTSYFTNPKIQSAVAKAGARILPKSLVPSVEISVLTKTVASVGQVSPDLVLIDDDDTIHTLWARQAKRADKNILLLKTETEMRNFKIEAGVPIYVDNNLGDGVSGLQVAKRLHEQGFENLFITTGDNPDTLPPVPYLNGVVGKLFPKTI